MLHYMFVLFTNSIYVTPHIYMQSAPLYAHAANRVCVGGETCGCIQGEINALSNHLGCTAVNYCAKIEQRCALQTKS
jgi:hypothetical protein